MRRTISLLALAVATLSVAGCQAASNVDSGSVDATSPTPAETTITASPVPSETIAANAQESLARFKLAAEESCNLAFTTGVTEAATDGSLIMVMVPEQAAIESYSAAYYAPETDEYGLLFEADAFVTCGAHLSFMLAAEAGADAKIAAEQQPDGSFFVLQDFGEFGIQGQSYYLEDGLFVSVSTTFDDYIRTTDIVYGSPSEPDAEILTKAFEEFFG